MSWFSGLWRAGYLLNKLAMKAKFNFGFPRTTSVAVTNCRQPSRSACCSMHSARWTSSFSCAGTKRGHQPHPTARHCTQDPLGVSTCGPWCGAIKAGPCRIYSYFLSHFYYQQVCVFKWALPTIQLSHRIAYTVIFHIKGNGLMTFPNKYI